MTKQVSDQSVSSGKATVKPQHLPYQTHRRLIGYLGFLLPPLLFLFAGIRPTNNLPQWVLLDSISAYYYTGAIEIFVGVLFTLSLFLFTYPGYKGVLADRIVGIIGGIAALGVAFFPTAAPPGVSEATWWTSITRTIHYLSTVILFSAFIVFSLWLFRKSSISLNRDRPLGKRLRNMIYLVCGLVMIACMLWAGSSFFTKASIFWPEAIALWAFAISWLVKGEAYRPIIDAVQALKKRNST